jgi:hypothetical protein
MARGGARPGAGRPARKSANTSPLSRGSVARARARARGGRKSKAVACRQGRALGDRSADPIKGDRRTRGSSEGRPDRRLRASTLHGRLPLKCEPNLFAIRAQLTYKTIREAINAHVGQGSLFCLTPEFLSDETPRAMFVSREVMEIVDGPPWPNSRDGRRYARLRGLFDAFTGGDFITVAADPFRKDACAILARVHPIAHEIWDFRCLDPAPGIRSLGCFAEQDAFVALTWNFRENLQAAAAWNAEIRLCKNEWQGLFGPLPPHAGKSLDEYVSYNFRSV